jgi:uncharacterized protein (DUF169 family)
MVLLARAAKNFPNCARGAQLVSKRTYRSETAYLDALARRVRVARGCSGHRRHRNLEEHEAVCTE